MNWTGLPEACIMLQLLSKGARRMQAVVQGLVCRQLPCNCNQVAA